MTLKPGTRYYIKGRAISPDGESPDSPVVEVVTGLGRPLGNFSPATPPVCLISSKQNIVFLSISPNPNITHHKIRISTLSDFSSITLSSCSSELNHSFYLSPSTPYFVEIVAVNPISQSPPLVLNISTNSLLKPPVLRGVDSLTAINARLYWDASNKATNYSLDVSLNPEFSNPFISQLNTGNVLSFNLNNLNQNTLYYARLKAINSNESSPYSNIISFQTLDGTKSDNTFQYLDFSVSQIISVEKGSDFLTWQWNNSFQAYLVQVSTESDFSSLIFDQTISNNYLRLNNLTGATLYYIRIKGINTYSQSKEFAYSSTSTLFSASNIQAPILISVENVSFSGFSCFWQTRPYATNYILKVNSDKYFLPNIDSFSLLGLLPDTQYTISLYGVDLGNSRVSLESNQIVVRTLASPTAITLNPAIVEEWNNIRISWTGDTQYTSYQVSLFDESFSVVGFYDNLSVGTNTFYTFRYGLISGRKYTYQVKGLIESQVASIASSSFTTPFLAPTVSVLADGLTVLWEGKVNKVEGMISKDGILSPLFPISTSLPFIQLPPDISFVRAYFEEGDSYSYKSNIVSIQEMPWIRIEKLTNSSVEIKFNNLSDFYFVQAFKEGTVLQGYESPLKISTNTFSLKNLTFNTEYLIKVFYDNKEFPLLVFRTLPYSSLNQGSTTFTPSDCKIIEKGSYYIALRFNTANKVLYRIRISQNEQLKYFEEYFTEKEVFFITNLIPNSTYFLEVRKIVVDEDGVGQLSLPVELTSNTLDEIEKENITNLTLNLFAPLEREGGQYEFSFAFSAPIQNITPIISTNNTFTEIIEVDYLEIPKANKFILFNLGAGTYYIKVQVNNGFFYSKESNVITFTV